MYATATPEIKRPASVSSGPKNPPRGHRMGVLSKDSSFMRLLNIRERRYDEWGAVMVYQLARRRHILRCPVPTFLRTRQKPVG